MRIGNTIAAAGVLLSLAVAASVGAQTASAAPVGKAISPAKHRADSRPLPAPVVTSKLPAGCGSTSVAGRVFYWCGAGSANAFAALSPDVGTASTTLTAAVATNDAAAATGSTGDGASDEC